MRISGVGFIDRNGHMHIHDNLVEGLSIYNGSILFGIYYPNTRSKYFLEPNKHDFMLTPIPYKLWPFTGRIIIRLTRQSSGMRDISTILSSSKLTILNSTSTRSAHRYSTWDLHVAVDELKVSDLTWDESNSQYLQVTERLKVVKRLLNNKIKHHLFKDENDASLNEPIRIKVNNGLHYFYNVNEERISKAKSKEEKLFFKSFSFRYGNGVIIPNSGGKINFILSNADPKEDDNIGLPLPTVLFAEADSHYLNFRFRLIPQTKLQRLFRLSIYYERHGEIYSSRGLTDYILSKIDPKFKIWRYWNQLYECRDEYGSGKLTYILEDTEDNDYQRRMVRQDLERFFEVSNNPRKKPEYLSHIEFRAQVTPVYPELINHYFSDQRRRLKTTKYDVFISFSSENKKAAEYIEKILSSLGCTCYLSGQRLRGGDLFPEHIRESLVSSREFCLLYSKKSRKSSWVNTELGAAWGLGKYIVPILYELSKSGILSEHERLRDLQYVEYFEDNLRQYAREVLQRRFSYIIEEGRMDHYVSE